MTKKKVVIGMSGGVDSSVAAALLLDGDYPVLSSYLGSIRRYLEGQNRREAAVCAQS